MFIRPVSSLLALVSVSALAQPILLLRTLTEEEEALKSKQIICITTSSIPEIANVPDGALKEPGSGFGLSWNQIKKAGFAKNNSENKIKTAESRKFTFGVTMDQGVNLPQFEDFFWGTTLAGVQVGTWTLVRDQSGNSTITLYPGRLFGNSSGWDLNADLRYNARTPYVFGPQNMSEAMESQSVSHGYSRVGTDGKSFSTYRLNKSSTVCELVPRDVIKD